MFWRSTFKVLLLATGGFLLGLFFDPEDGGGTFCQTQNQCYNPEDTILHRRHHENLKSKHNDVIFA
jgi:hypothetical protein